MTEKSRQNKKSGILVSVVLILVLLLFGVGILGYFTNFFRDFSKITGDKKPNETVREFVKVGDVLNGIYCNTQIEPDFSKLDWSDAYTIPDYDDRNETITIMFLIAGFNPEDWVAGEDVENAELSISIWKYSKYDDKGFLCYNPSAGLYVEEEHGQLYPEGWWINSVDGFVGDKSSTGISVKYVAPEQDIWGEWVGNSSFFYVPEFFENGDEISSLYVNKKMSDSEMVELIDRNYQANCRYEVRWNNEQSGIAGDGIFMKLIKYEEPSLSEDLYLFYLMDPNNKEVPLILWSSAAFSLYDGEIAATKAGWQDIVGKDGFVKDVYPNGSTIYFNINNKSEEMFAQMLAKTSFFE